MRWFLALWPLALAVSVAYGEQHIAPTDALTPDEERKTFKVPDGFEVQLVASEAQIQKPMQIAFDAKGRLWVTTSRHYPFAAEKGKSTDKIFILSDFGNDGHAKTITTFDDKLNIPIGILPLPDGKSCIVSSVGEILKLTDTDGDGKADLREVLFTGFGTRDTHGMTNSFTLMPDGWVYACHGFSNESTVVGKDGHEVKMQSGHTFRFRTDGSRIEVFTRGQVNPFGMTADPWFNLYTADCHSKPITQLIKGAYYDSFGKPHDGLGYAPHVTRHDHGSTGLCGLAWYDADHFPKEWNGCMFLGNVVTNRINIDRIEWKGSTPVAKELPDFLVSSDPWFRPTDIKLGPDGALYVSDFYNKIIGHYEVDLKHPQRDKDKSRVWRIVWKGKVKPGVSAPESLLKMPFADLTTEKPERLVELTGSTNITIRHMATQELIRRGKNVLPVAKSQFTTGKSLKSSQFVHLTWVITRQEFRPQLHLAALDATDEERSVVLAMAKRALITRPIDDAAAAAFDKRVIELRKNLKNATVGKTVVNEKPLNEIARAFRFDIDRDLESPFIDMEMISTLSSIVLRSSPEDTHLRYASRIAMRNILVDPDVEAQLTRVLGEYVPSNSKHVAVLDDVFLGVPTVKAGWWLSERIHADTLDATALERAYTHIGRYGTDPQRIVALLAAQKSNDHNRKLILLQALKQGANTAGVVVKWEQSTRLIREVQEGLSSDSDEILIRSLAMAATMEMNVSNEAMDLCRSPKRSEAVRSAAFSAIEKQSKEQILPVCREILSDVNLTTALKEKAISILATSTKLPDQVTLKEQLKTAPYRQCVMIANSLAGNKNGADLLFAAIKTGNASARLLQEKVVLERLQATNPANWEATVKELTAGIPSADARLAGIIKERGTGYKTAKTDIAAGKALFTTNCANCHQLGGQGAKVGPQLDGIGNRGIERLLEDVLDPNRNVDHAFHTTILDMKDGRTLTGLLRVEGKVFIIIDALAKEVRVSIDDVEKKRTSPQSPMPADVSEKLKPQEFYHLMAYLLDQRPK